MATPNDPAQPPKKSENEQKLDSLLEDIRYALMDYQVRTPKRLASDVSNMYLRLHYNKNSTTKTVSRL